MLEQQASVLQDPGGTLGHAATFAQGPKASGVQVQAEHTRSLLEILLSVCMGLCSIA